MNYIYRRSDLDRNRVVRQNSAIFEQYCKGVGWTENPERIDMITGIDPHYTEITEEEAMQIIDEIERSEENLANE